jgi:hypothetical protein
VGELRFEFVEPLLMLLLLLLLLSMAESGERARLPSSELSVREEEGEIGVKRSSGAMQVGSCCIV